MWKKTKEGAGTMALKHRRRDWFRLLRDLMAAGVSMQAVGRACGRKVGTVANWADNGEPKDSDARVVLSLYRKHCPAQYEAHMKEFEPEVLEYDKRIPVRSDRAIRHRPRPDQVWVNPSTQFDFFVQGEGA
jgi:hypothetical protein